MTASKLLFITSTALLAVMPLRALAEESISYDASVTGGVSSGDFAPYYLASNRFGTITQGDNLQLNLGFARDLNLGKRFDWTYGARAVAGAYSSVRYDVYNTTSESFDSHAERPASIWLQELWAGVKWRCLYLTGGMRQDGSPWLDESLSSGDLVKSSNARPLPGVDAGFVDFQTFPWTKGWLEVKGSLAFRWFTDNSYLKNRYNYYSYHITLDQAYCYRDVYFRSRASEPFSVMIGAQVASLFAGTTYRYNEGTLESVTHNPSGFKTYMKMFVPHEGGSELYYDGQHLGAWDISARYRFRSGHTLTAYTQWLWEDGSGMGKLNGWDGMWGLKFTAHEPWWIDGAAVEYLDFTNHSGPVHFAPQHSDWVFGHTRATGADNYYNNVTYNGYSNYGMAMGGPSFMSPIYNRDGFPAFRQNRFRGFHAAVNGHLHPDLTYSLKVGYRKGYGTPYLPVREPRHLTSAMFGLDWKISRVKGLSASLQAGADRGNMPSRSYGVLIGVKYEGIATF
ncbi:MAG: capsule assembly Wzi family protein [Candidatus Amulumruptor caecigallinarius]|nr:capsule assembly Wzi family protein [Candidatus Amulumruptor caecigallinarius]MCM1396205.1 capsule assembly Wzi family protein [Candidatus Amulumruptor caecigallinarius]MCM1453795.1 capsule assembly Wzi family protein [bacterium]